MARTKQHPIRESERLRIKNVRNEAAKEIRQLALRNGPTSSK
jgi:hypothetical protein